MAEGFLNKLDKMFWTLSNKFWVWVSFTRVKNKNNK